MNFEEFEVQLNKLRISEGEILVWEIGDADNVVDQRTLNEFTEAIQKLQKHYKERTGKEIFNLVLPSGIIHSIKSITVNQELLKDEKLKKRFSIRRNLYKK